MCASVRANSVHMQCTVGSRRAITTHKYGRSYQYRASRYRRQTCTSVPCAQQQPCLGFVEQMLSPRGFSPEATDLAFNGAAGRRAVLLSSDVDCVALAWLV